MTNRLRALLTAAILASVISMPAMGQMHSSLQQDESVQFFRTAAYLGGNAAWQVPIHAWVYEPERSVARKGVVAGALEAKYGLLADGSTRANFDHRVNLLLADNERGKRLVIRLHGREYTLPEKTDARGHVHVALAIPAQALPAVGDRIVSVPYQLLLGSGDARKFHGEVLLIPDAGVSLISDIDDTVKHSDVLDKRKLMERTFYQDFVAVSGMAGLYRQLFERQIPLHFVSSSPWQLYAPLEEFFAASRFPPFTTELKTIRLKDSSILDLFKGGDETKPLQIEPLLQRYPHRRFILIGDSGEQDPEAYRAVMRKHPQQILGAYIRNVTAARADDARFGPLITEFGADKFMLFNDPAEVGRHLAQRGVL
jgi:hypothetical protein